MGNKNTDIKNGTTEARPSEDVRVSGADESKRRLLKGAITAAPVVMAVTSMPVWGNNCSLSGILSGPNSGGQDTYQCQGCTPGFWKTNPNVWPGEHPGGSTVGFYNEDSGTCSKTEGGQGNSTCKNWDNTGTKFDTIFGGGAAASLGLFDEDNLPMSLMQVMWAEKSKTHANGALGAHLVAAYFNAWSFPANFGYTKEQVALWLSNPPPELADSSFTTLKEFVVQWNEVGCPLSANG